MRSLQQRFYPDAPVECPLCARAAEDCSHLFFECQFVQMVWRATPTCCLVMSSADSFWRSISRGHFDMCWNDNLFSPLCGEFGFIGTTLALEVVSLQPTQFSTTRGGLLISGTEVVSTSRVLDLCNGLFVPHH